MVTRKRPLLRLGVLALLLGLGTGAPARATATTINTAVAGPLTVNAGDVVDIVAGGSVTVVNGPDTSSVTSVTVNAGGTLNLSGGSVTVVNDPNSPDVPPVIVNTGGTLNLSSGSVNGGFYGVFIAGGTVTISGGSVHPGNHGVQIDSGTLNISGGTLNDVNAYGGTVTISGGRVTESVWSGGATVAISGGTLNDVGAGRGTMTISGCNLLLANGKLTGTLLDGTPISTTAFVSSPGVLILDTGQSPIATSPPQGQTVVAGQTATFTAAAAGTPPPSVQWQVSTDQGSVFSNIGGATSTTLAFTTAAADSGNQYRAVFTNSCGSALTTAASLTVTTTTPPSFTSCPGNLTVNNDPGQCSALVPFGVSATGTPAPTVVCTVGTTAITSPSRFPVGATIVVCTASNSAGTASCTFTVTVKDAAKPAFTNCPSASIPATATCTASGTGALVSFPSLAASDNCGTPTVSCDHQSGSFFSPGSTTVTATATDAAGNPAPCSFSVSVTYAWSGVLQPIKADGSSVFKAGNTVPVVFQLTGPSACITNAAATLSYALVSKSVAGSVNAAGSTSTATTGSLFRYSSGQYVFNWGTKGLTAGTYLLRIDLQDGVVHTVNLSLK